MRRVVLSLVARVLSLGSDLHAQRGAAKSTSQIAREATPAEARNAVDAVLGLNVRNPSAVIGGDFNFKSLGARDVSETLQSTKQEAAALAHFREKKLGIVWSETHVGQPLPQTLRWNKNKSVPYHCDGLLIRPFDASCVVCEVLSSDFVRSNSDHNAVLAVTL